MVNVFATLANSPNISSSVLSSPTANIKLKYYPRSLYYNIRLAEVLGVCLREVTSGKLQVNVLNEKNKEIQLPKEYSFYAAKSFRGGDKINILITIPLVPSDTNNKIYNYKILFETGTGKQIIEMTGKIGYK